MYRILFLSILVSAAFSTPARAACTSPNGQETQTRYDFAAHKLYYCNNTNWVEMGGLTNPLTGTLDMGTNRILNVGPPTANTDAASKEYVDVTIAAAAGGASYSTFWFKAATTYPTCPAGFDEIGRCLANGSCESYVFANNIQITYTGSYPQIKVAGGGASTIGALNQTQTTICAK